MSLTIIVTLCVQLFYGHLFVIHRLPPLLIQTTQLNHLLLLKLFFLLVLSFLVLLLLVQYRLSQLFVLLNLGPIIHLLDANESIQPGLLALHLQVKVLHDVWAGHPGLLRVWVWLRLVTHLELRAGYLSHRADINGTRLLETTSLAARVLR